MTKALGARVVQCEACWDKHGSAIEPRGAGRASCLMPHVLRMLVGQRACCCALASSLTSRLSLRQIAAFVSLELLSPLDCPGRRTGTRSGTRRLSISPEGPERPEGEAASTPRHTHCRRLPRSSLTSHHSQHPDLTTFHQQFHHPSAVLLYEHDTTHSGECLFLAQPYWACPGRHHKCTCPIVKLR